MANLNRNTRFSAEVNRAQVASALVLIEELSIKSSDSGLSEETCWEIFGGPCPEALRKKIKSLQEHALAEEEVDDFLLLTKVPVAENNENTQKDIQYTDGITTKDNQETNDLQVEFEEDGSRDDAESRKTNISKESKLSDKTNIPKKDPSLSKNGSLDQTPRKINTSMESKLSEKLTTSKKESQGSGPGKQLSKNGSLEKGQRKSKESGKLSSKDDKPSDESFRETKISTESKVTDKSNTSQKDQLSNFQENQLIKNGSLENSHRKSREKNIEDDINSKDGQRVRETKTSKESKFSGKSNTSNTGPRKSNESEKNIESEANFKDESPRKMPEPNDSTISEKTNNSKKSPRRSKESGKNIKGEVNSKDDQPSRETKVSKESALSETKNGSKKEQLHTLQEEELYMNDRLENDTRENIESGNSREIQPLKNNKVDKASLTRSKSTEKLMNSVNLKELPDNEKVHPKSKSSIGTCSSLLENGANEGVTSRDQPTTIESPTKISVGSQKSGKSIATKTTDVSTSRTSIRIRKMGTRIETKRHHSLISDSYSSSEIYVRLKKGQYDTSDSSDLQACHCIHCIEHQIQEYHKNEISKCRCVKKEDENSPCCNQPHTLADNNTEVKIYDNDLSGDSESNKKAYKVTTFDDSDQNTCNRKQQTSMVHMFEPSRSACPCCCRPYDIDPIYPNSGFSPALSNKLPNSSVTRKKKSVKKDCQCAGDFKQQSIQLPEYFKNSDENLESSSTGLSEGEVVNIKGDCSLANSLKGALLKRSVKETVKKFENNYALHVFDESNHQDFQKSSRKPRNIKHKEKNYWPIVSSNEGEICKCCRQLKPPMERRPYVPALMPCYYCNYKNHYQ